MFPVIGELKLIPGFGGTLIILEVRKHVEGGERFFFKVAEVIKEKRLRRWRGDCEHIARGIPSREVCAVEVKLATCVLGSCVPDTQGIVFTAGKEVVLTWMKRETRDVLLMALKVPQI